MPIVPNRNLPDRDEEFAMKAVFSAEKYKAIVQIQTDQNKPALAVNDPESILE